MKMTAGQKELISKFVPIFKNYLMTGGRDADLKDLQERSILYSHLLSPDGLVQMTELEFGQVISSLWASLMWGNKGYLVDKLLQDNQLSELKVQLKQLLWGIGSIATRYDSFRRSIRGFGTAMITEILAYIHPDECGLWNDKARKALILLGFKDTLAFINRNQLTGTEYQQFNELLCLIQIELESKGLSKLDLLGIDYFLFEVWNSRQEKEEFLSDEEETSGLPLDFDHDTVVEELVAIGQWLGFQAEKGKKVAKGAIVDVVWRAGISNLGVVTYVFEVQRKGSLDSLILNLQRAQNNPSVQKLIVVANSEDILKVRQEVESLPESFRRVVSYMEVSEERRAAELTNELSGIINKLELVKSEFGV